jgi:DNA-binding response OmpR family regulator
MNKILIVDDDVSFRNALACRIAFATQSEIEEAGDAAQARQCARRKLSDLILMDVGLPDMDGRDLCRLMRREGVTCPIIMLTGASEDADVILGFEAGANDYVVKPIKFEVLLARMRSQLRQHHQSDDAIYSIGPYAFRPGAKLLVNGDVQPPKKVRLTSKEARLLKQLYRANGRLLERQALLEAVWGYSSRVESHTLESHIYRLRQKIEPDPAAPTLIRSGEGGYYMPRSLRK